MRALRERALLLTHASSTTSPRVEVLNVFSAHADRNDLLAFADACGVATRSFFLVHGEPAQQASLSEAMEARGMRVAVPTRGEVVELA